ncbi:MAG: multicopper oxidase family protein [Deltaproteobacteria bacterium]|nr:multicopper oxidase family protein [Deltaproteobacteria bacterium]
MTPSHAHHAHHTAHVHRAVDPGAATVDLASLYAMQSGPTPPRLIRAPREVHVELDARITTWSYAPGRTTTAWGFQGAVPGPAIIAHVGDTLVAHLVNHLPEPTTIHWHGLRVPAVMDGTDAVQPLVPPGGRFEYRFALPDAGTFWYHAHANETVQIERGLYGALVVLGPDEPVFDADRVLVLDDLKVDRRGEIARTALFDRHSGREGDVLLINGQATPELTIAAGQVERWRLVNACNARYARLSLGGRPFRVIGADGGLRDAAITVTETLLPPGARVELAVGPFDDVGAAIAIESLPYKRSGMKRARRATWGALRVGPRQPSRALLPEVLATITPLITDGDLTPTRTIELGARMTLHGHDWLVNGELHHQDEPVKVGELEVWDVINDTGLDHPFHLHGFFFQVVAIDDVPTVPRAWHDTVNVVARGRVTIAFRADDRPGEWMYHCHILEHHAAGMMGHFSVVR